MSLWCKHWRMRFFVSKDWSPLFVLTQAFPTLSTGRSHAEHNLHLVSSAEGQHSCHLALMHPCSPRSALSHLFWWLWALRKWDHPQCKLQRKKGGDLGLSLEEQEHHSEGTGHGVWGIFFSKEIHNGCVVQRKENLNEKVRETCRTRILLSHVTKFSSTAAQVCGQCFN